MEQSPWRLLYKPQCLKWMCKRTVALAKEAGVTLTPAGATYPYGNDPDDSNIRIAPTYPPVSELRTAMEILSVCIELAAIERFWLNQQL